MDYMVHYPKLQVTYPPLFHIVTGILFYSIFGVSEMTGKLSAIFFSLLSACALYFLIRKLFDERVAFLSTFLFLLNPLSIFYSYRMLTDFSAWVFVFMSVYAFLIAMEKDRGRYFALSGILAFLAAMGKRPAIILIVVLFFYGIFRRKFRNSLLMLAVFAILMTPYLLIMLETGGIRVHMLVVQTTGKYQGEPNLFTFENWIWYFLRFIEYTGPLSVGLLAGLIFYVYRKEKYYKPILLWMFIFWIGLSIPQNKEPRFFQYIFLPAYVAFSYYLFRFKNRMELFTPAILLIMLYLTGSVAFVSSDIKRNAVSDVVNFINTNISGNVAVISERGDIYSSEFIFLFAAADKNKTKFVYRPCAFDGMNKDEILNYMRKNNIEYVVAVNKGFDENDKSFYGYKNLEKIKNNLEFVKNFEDIDVYRVTNFTFVRGETCNKICLTNQIICTNNTSPFDMLK